MLISRLLAISALVSVFLSVPSFLSWGNTNSYNPSSFQSVDCSLSPNPLECEQQKQSWMASDPVAYLSGKSYTNGPISAGIKYDNELGWILGLGVVQMIDGNMGVALKMGLGANEIRGNLTGGWAFTDNQQLKITYEYLRQNLPFDFATGTVNSWVYQNGIGGAYQYLLRSRILHSLELSGHYIASANQNYDSILFYEGNTPYINIRRIAGGKEKTVQAVANFSPFYNTILALGGGYSTVNYDTKYENGQDVSTVAYKAELSHLLRPTIKLSAAVNNNASNTDSNLKVSKIVKNVELALTGEYSQGRGNIQDSKTIMLGVNYPAPKVYALASQDVMTELKNWIEKPVLFVPRVLAVRDELVQQYQIAQTAPIPDQKVYEGSSIEEVETNQYFKFNSDLYEEVKYTFSIVSAVDNSVPEKNLNLALKQTNKYEASLYSIEPIPSQSASQYKVTITGVGYNKDAKQNATESSSFTLNVLSLAPTWTDKALQVASMGQPYPDVDLNDGYVNVPNNETYSFQLISSPDWITLKDDKHTLTAVEGKLVPQDNLAPLPVVLKVTDQNNYSSQKSFNLIIDQQLPVWNTTVSYDDWAIQYDDTISGLPLNSYVIEGVTNLSFSFSNNQLTSGNWTIQNRDGVYYLRRNTPASPLPGDVGEVIELTLVAHNSTSTAENQESGAAQKIKVKVLADQNLPAPAWSNTNLTAVAGDTTFKVDLSSLIQDGINGDSYVFTLSDQPSWLTLSNDGKFLIAASPVPPVDTGNSGQVFLTLNAVSKASGKSTSPTVFTLTVTNLFPVWLSPIPTDQTNIPFDATPDSSVSGVNLNTLIAQNNANIKFALSSDGQTLTSGNWTIVTDGVNYSLKRTQANSSDIGVTESVTVFAFNSTSNGGVGSNIPVTIVGDPSLAGPQWNNTDLPEATAGQSSDTYNFLVNQLFDCPANDTCTIETDLSQVSSWLAAQSSSLKASAKAAGATQVTLVNIASVPAASVDPEGPSEPLTIKVNSLISGKSIEKAFNINIQNKLPEWVNPSNVPDLLFDGQSPDSTIYLNTYIKSGTDIGLKFIPGNGFDNKNWKIIQLGNDYYLQRQANASAEDIGQSISVPIQALNETSANGSINNVQINVVADTALNPPVWAGDISDAPMGYPYPQIDLNAIVNPSISNDVLTYSFVNDQHPAWLDIQPCNVSGNASYCLVSVGNVPTDAGNNFTITIRASSLASGKYTDQTYTKNITQQLPQWINNPSMNMLYDDLNDGIELSQFIQSGQGNTQGNQPILSFALKDANNPNWEIKNQNGLYYLFMTSQNPAYGNPDSINTQFNADVIAYNNTSDAGVEQTLTINIVQNANLPAPDWSNNNPASAQAGSAVDTYHDSVADLFVCPQNDKCAIELDLSNLQTWLTASFNADKTQATLSNSAIIPAAVADPSAPSETFHVKVTSLASGKTIEKDFDITINNVLPKWLLLPAVNLNFDGTTSPGILLNDYIVSGTDANLTFVPGQNFDNANWQIIQNGDNYYLQRQSDGSIEDIGQTISVPVLAKNSTSQDGTASTVLVTITSDAQLGNPTVIGDIVSAPMGYPYPLVDLNQVFSGVTQNDTLNFSLSEGHPSWLTIQACNISGQPSYCLAANGDVPITEGDAFTVNILATSRASGQTLNQSFTKTVTQQYPQWSDTPSGSIPFNSLTQGIELNTFITQNQGNPQGLGQPLQFQLDSSSQADWQIIENNGQYYLYMTANNPAYENLDYLNGVKLLTPPKVFAINNTSNQPIPADINITLLADSSKPVPAWNSNTPSDTLAQTTEYTIKLCQLIDSGNCTDDQYQFTVTNLKGTDIQDPAQWLVSDGQNLVAAVVPTATVDPQNGSALVNFTVMAQSKTSGEKSITKDFSFKVTNVLPVWNTPPVFDMAFDDDTSTTIRLNDYIQSGSDIAPLTFLPGTGFDASRWQIVQQGNDYFLRRQKTASLDDIDQIMTVPILAKNGASYNGSQGTVSVHITADQNLGAPTVVQSIPDAAMGYAYSKVDLNTIFAGVANGDKLTFNLPQGYPSWLQDIQPCAGDSGMDSYCLIPNGDVTTNVQPSDSFSLTISATSQASGLTYTYTFNPKILQWSVVWGSDPTGTISFNSLTQGIDLKSLLAFNFGNPGGQEQPALYFEIDDPNWNVVNSNGNGYLYMTAQNPAYNQVNQIGQVVPVEVTAYNNTSSVGTPQVINVTIGADNTLAAPNWNGNQPIQGTAGQAINTYRYGLQQLFDCPVNDICTITTDINTLPWAQINYANNNQQATLENIQVMPKGDLDPPSIGNSLPFSVTVTSKASGKSVTQSFTVPILNVLPQWQDPAQAPSLIYDGNSTNNRVYLNPYIINGASGLSFEPGQGFDSVHWAIQNQGNDYYLVKISGNPNEIGTAPLVSVMAKNNTSVNGEAHEVPVNIIVDSDLNPAWTATTLPSAYMGYTYGDGNKTPLINLNNMIATQGEPNDTYTFSFDPGVSHPSWLVLDVNTGILSSNNFVVPDDQGTTFNVGLIATSQASGKPVPLTINDIPIIETPPVWNTAPGDNYNWQVAYDDTSQGIPLSGYITDDNVGLSFTFEDGSTSNGNWQIVKDNGIDYLRRNTSSDPMPSDINTQVNLTLIAHNTTSTPGTQQEQSRQIVNVQILPDTNLQPEWNQNAVIPDAYMGYAYGDSTKTGIVDLNPMISTPGVSNDTFTFSFDDSDSTVGAHPDWLTIDTSGHLVSTEDVPKDAQSFAVKINAVSKASGVTKSFIFGQTNKVKIIETPAVWQNVMNSTLQFNTANPVPSQSNTTLANWISPSTAKDVTFRLDTQGTTQCNGTFIAANWVITSNNPAQIVRTTAGKSDPSDISTTVQIPVLATNSTSNQSVGQCIPVDLTPDSTLNAPTWIAGKELPAIYGGESGLYSYPVNSVGLNLANDSKYGAYLDDNGRPYNTNQFICQIVAISGTNADGSPVPIIIDPTNSQRIKNNTAVNGNGMPPIDDKPIVTLTCQSKASGKWTNPKSFIVDVAPVLKQQYLQGQGTMQFDDLTVGIPLYNMMISGKKGLNFSQYDTGSPQNISANWIITPNTGTPNNQYLRRSLDANQQIDASELVRYGGNAEVGFNFTNSTSSVLGVQSIIIKLTPDPGVFYGYAGDPWNSNIAAVEPALSTNKNQVQIKIVPSEIITYMPKSAGYYQVKNDNPVMFQDRVPGLPDYVKLLDQEVDIEYTTMSNFGTNVIWGLYMGSSANGNIKSLMDMYSISVNKLVIIPPSTNGQVGNLNLGNDYHVIGGAGNRRNYTYLQVSNLPKNQSYAVNQILVNFPGGTNGAKIIQMCPEITTGEKPTPIDGNTCPLLDLNNGRYPTDGNGNMTILPSVTYYNGSSNYPTILTNPDPASKAGNIIISIP